ncbi:amidase [Ascoidea rubescens DSM 1968]|uniref:Carbon-nitrogen hydrolase n=1 Tax=Ascoidea rubescens DSM 1968 TaxID=1344418 RepID=A0A1D2VQ19_9ASCO|nr:carbon-nitrogen hydrolase [Ascoidea rubescens DSM 1968]ODV63722.1 carbon-nitrogen hydrolase [Ascoidea rubescens DSM 1968]
MMKFRVACLQLNPKIGSFNENAKRASLILSNYFSKHDSLSKKKLDLIVLPEFSLTGYNFSSKDHIRPYLENISKGIELNNFDDCPSISWAIDLSNKYKCFTLIGYPEIHNGKNFNSTCLVHPNGSVAFNYRKSFLYDTDYQWDCQENPNGFQVFPVNLSDSVEGANDKNTKKTNVSIGICMDLNPYKFEAPFMDFEFSTFCKTNHCSLILCPMAWLNSSSPSLIPDKKSNQLNEKKNYYKNIFDAYEKDGNESNIEYNCDNSNTITKNNFNFDTQNEKFDYFKKNYSNLNYWILRFFPFINTIYYKNSIESFYLPQDKNESTHVIICNRVGIEDDILYGGSSSILKFNGKSPFASKDPGNDFSEYDITNSSIEILGSLNMGNEGILVRDIDISTT